MPHASWELQKALHALLVADSAVQLLLGGPAIYDRAPPDAGFPYVTFGAGGADDWSTQTEDGLEHRILIDVWSRDQGRSEALEIADAIVLAVDDADLAMTGHVLVGIDHLGTETVLDEDGETYHAAIRFRAVTEPSP